MHCLQLKRNNIMKAISLLALFFTFALGSAQNDIEWDGLYKIKLSDFQSPSTQIGGVTTNSLYVAAGIDFSFYMSNVEFMLTKNFNPKVNCTFKRTASSLVATDSIMANDMLNFAQYEFDLSELYARKFRKRIYEEKGAFTNTTFFKPIFDEIQKEYSERFTQEGKITEIGRKKEVLIDLHQAVLKEIEEYSDYCKSCKPLKKTK
jgi:hypothetical protein